MLRIKEGLKLEKAHNCIIQRIEYIDIFRAIGIVLMVMGHIGFGKEFDHVIHAFHMPMFFFISGFLFKKKDATFVSFLGKKAKTLLLPYCIFGTLLYVIDSIKEGAFSFEPIKNLLIYPTNLFSIAGALWFLIALFIADIIFYWTSRIKIGHIRLVLVIVFSLVGQLIPKYTGLLLPFALSGALVGVGLMYIGSILRPYEQVITGLRAYQVFLFSALIGFSIYTSSYVNVREGIYPDDVIIFWVNAVSTSILLLNIAKKGKQILKNSFLCRYLQSIGRNSIVFVCLNQLVIVLCFDAAYGVVDRLPISSVPILLIRFAVLLTSLVLLSLLSLLFEKTFFRVILGKF